MYNVEKYQCLVCHREMDYTHKNLYVDYYCNKANDHHLSWRIHRGQIAKLRIRFSNPGERLHLKVHYDEGYSEVWTVVNSPHRMRINQVVLVNFDNLDRLRAKIRTLLAFA